MLQSIRDRLTGPIVWAVVGLIAVPFAFWGIESFRSGDGDPTVVKVGDQKITQAQLQRAYDQRLRQLQEMLGENFRSDMIEPTRFRDGVLQEMIQETALRQHARSVGYVADDKALLNTLSTIPAFQKDGKFSSEAYRSALARQGMTPEGFEQQLREGLVMDGVRDAVVATAFVTPSEAAANWRLSQQERDFRYVTFRTSAYASAITVSDEDVAKHFAAHGDRYTAPERLKLQYVELDLSKLTESAAPDQTVLKALYDADSSRFASSEERRASHILINFGADKTAAKAKAQALKAKLDGGADFAALARENSDDTGSKSSGGDLGWVRRGTMTPKFEAALFALDAHAVSEPVETEFGWHLIRLAEIKGATTKAFGDPAVQEELLSSYRKKDAEKRYQEMSEKLEQLAFENAGSLEPVAKALGLTIQTTDWMGRSGGQGVAGNPDVIKAAFSAEVLKDGENSKPIALGQGRQAVIRKGEYEAAHPRKLEEVKDEIRKALSDERARTQAIAAADALIKASPASATDFTAAVSALQLVPVEAGLVRRDATTVDREVLAAAFKAARPAAAKINLNKVVQANGDVVVLALTDVRDAMPSPDDSKFKAQGQQLRDAVAGSEFLGFRQTIETVLGVKRKELPPISAPAAE